jgi:hypothetical protein
MTGPERRQRLDKKTRLRRLSVETIEVPERLTRNFGVLKSQGLEKTNEARIQSMERLGYRKKGRSTDKEG